MAAAVTETAIVPRYTPDFDQAQVLYVARDFVEHGVFTNHGILNSRYAFNPPFFVWLYLLPMWLGLDVSWVLILPALSLHILALLLLFMIGKDYFSRDVGLAAATLYAFSRLGVYFGQASWAQGLLSPHYVLVLFCVFRWLVDGKTWYSAPR